jgi:hydroxymethylbilane synthase
VGQGAIAAAVLALAGMKRLGLDALGVGLALEPLEARTTRPETGPHPLTVTPLSVEISIPAVGQGALAIECRADDARIRGLLAPLEHFETRIAIEAERAFLQTLHGSCSTPLAAHARLEAGMFRMDAMVGSLDGDTVLVAGTAETMSPHDGAEGRARVIGRQLAERLLAEGAEKIIDHARAAADPYLYLYSR